jgi:phosphate starvation-inducible protein PhoH and related proteins
VRIGVNGSTLRISGAHPEQALAGKVLSELYEIVKQGHPIYPSDVEYSVRILRADGNVDLKDIFLDTIYISAHKRVIAPKSVNQKRYIDAIRGHDIVFGIGPAGTGKTYLAMAMALAALMKNQVTRMVLCRPAVEAGERLGFLPGDLAEKVNPYLRPLYDALHDMVDFDRARRMLERGTIEVAPPVIKPSTNGACNSERLSVLLVNPFVSAIMIEKIIVVAPTTAVPISTGLAVALNVFPAPSFSSSRCLARSKFTSML